MRNIKEIFVGTMITVVIMLFVGCASIEKVNNFINGLNSVEQAIMDGKFFNVTTYTVKKGDTLWCIAGKKEIYDESFAWPILYKANNSTISNPDEIEVGQLLIINKDFSQADINVAIQIAKACEPYSKKK